MSPDFFAEVGAFLFVLFTTARVGLAVFLLTLKQVSVSIPIPLYTLYFEDYRLEVIGLNKTKD